MYVCNTSNKKSKMFYKREGEKLELSLFSSILLCINIEKHKRDTAVSNSGLYMEKGH